MSRVALVTGGATGIGASIANSLRGAGDKVVATYVGNQKKSPAFKAEPNIISCRWNAIDYKACRAGLAKVEAEVGAVDILTKNAGITPDGMFRKMTPV